MSEKPYIPEDLKPEQLASAPQASPPFSVDKTDEYDSRTPSQAELAAAPQALPPLDYHMAAHEQCDERERQLAAALGEVAALREHLKTVLDREAASQKRHEERLAALQASHDRLLEALLELIFASKGIVDESYLRDAGAVIAQAETLKEKP